ncbi:MAG: hypothetical protein JSV67_05400, partial [Thermoplasmatales archaeon]
MNDSIKSKINTVPHWPKEGIMFRDITTLLEDLMDVRETIDLLYKRYKDRIFPALFPELSNRHDSTGSSDSHYCFPCGICYCTDQIP